MDLDTQKKKKNEQDGLKVTQQKPDVLGVSKSLAFIFHASAHFTSLPNILTSSFALLSLPDTICPQTADQGTTPLVTCWAGTVPDRHSPKLVLLYAGLLYYYSYGHIIQAVCMRAVQWLYNGCIYVCCVVGRPGQVSTLSHVGGVAPALLPNPLFHPNGWKPSLIAPVGSQPGAC